MCLFSYGQTGAGKTYTMEGGRAPEQRGIIPRTIAKVSFGPLNVTHACLVGVLANGMGVSSRP